MEIIYFFATLLAGAFCLYSYYKDDMKEAIFFLLIFMLTVFSNAMHDIKAELIKQNEHFNIEIIEE